MSGSYDRLGNDIGCGKEYEVCKIQGGRYHDVQVGAGGCLGRGLGL